MPTKTNRRKKSLPMVIWHDWLRCRPVVGTVTNWLTLHHLAIIGQGGATVRQFKDVAGIGAVHPESIRRRLAHLITMGLVTSETMSRTKTGKPFSRGLRYYMLTPLGRRFAGLPKRKSNHISSQP